MKGSSDQTVIIKKVNKSEGGGHGGSWKVAYADFVTAMMAFFLLLWLITMVAPEKRARVSNYFKYFGLFNKTGTVVFDIGYEIDQSHKQDPFKERSEKQKKNSLVIQKRLVQITPKETLQEQLQEQTRMRLAQYQDQVMINLNPYGVSIEVMDVEGKPIFPLGQAQMNPNGRNILKVIAENLKGVENKIAIGGHTDAYNYATNQYTNWELSTERASAARKEMESCGLDPNQLAIVAGYAATQPLIKDNPYDPRNRRISIMVLYGNPDVPPDAQPAQGSKEPPREISEGNSPVEEG